MTCKEAIECFPLSCMYDHRSYAKDAFSAAIEAFEKQIPHKTTAPNNLIEHQFFCDNCWQDIDWV